MSRLTRTSLMLALFFGVSKLLSVVRQLIIARQFGLSAELDAFNAANNLPDLLFALISGGALAVAFIPVLSQALSLEGRGTAWELFSRIANLAFSVTALLALLTAVFADPLVRWELGIAPGFHLDQQQLVVELMRLNLIATLIFSISGLVMAGLQANQHFFLPALAPLFYDFGQITGALIFAPSEGYTLGSITLPAFGLGVQGLVYGVIMGAALHLGIQVPGLFRYKFRWTPGFGLDNPFVLKVLRLLGPRLATMFFIQLIFLIRDNLASRLQEGAVTALTYGWMIQQVPETLIGTAIGTALLPTLSELAAKEHREAFQQTIQRAFQVLIAITLPVSVVLSVGLRPLLAFAFGFGDAGTDLLYWTTCGYLVGLVGHSLLEMAARSFYAQQDALRPLMGAVLNVSLYILLGSQLFRILGAPGVSLTDSIAFTAQALFLIVMLNRGLVKRLSLMQTMWRSLIAAGLGGGITAVAVTSGFGGWPPVFLALSGLALGGLIALPLIWREMRLLLRL